MSGGQTPYKAFYRLDVFGRGAAAAADHVDEALLGELAQVAARVARLLVVRPHLVRQPRVRVARDPGRRDPGEVLDERPHLARPERAVDADDERLRVPATKPLPSAAASGASRAPSRFISRTWASSP